MKQKILLATLCITYCICAHAQTRFTPQKSYIYNPCTTCPCPDGTPTLADLSGFPAIPQDEVKRIYPKLRDLNIEFGYPQGNCHDRAHAMAVVLFNMGIQSAKIWNFAPNRVSLLSDESLSITDPNQFDPDGTINWGYHVAPIILVERQNGNGVDTLVVDPSIFPDQPHNYQEWLAKQNQPASYYTFLDSKWYLFYSLRDFVANDVNDRDKDGSTYQPITLPKWFPNLLTGLFYQYCGPARDNHQLETGLAQNSTAMQFYHDELLPILNGGDMQKISDYKILMGSILNLQDVFARKKTNKDANIDLVLRNSEVINKYQRILEKQKSDWINKMNPLLNP